jgi:hypothetical protein
VSNEIAAIYADRGIEYSEELHQFIINKRKTSEKIKHFLETQSVSNIKNVLYNFRDQYIQDIANNIKAVYNDLKQQFNCSEKEFSYLAQSATSNPSSRHEEGELASLFQKIASQLSTEEARKIISQYQKIIFTKLAFSIKDQPFKALYMGKLNALELQPFVATLNRETKDGPLHAILGDLLKAPTKEDILDRADFSQSRFPLSVERYWPKISDANMKDIYDKIILNVNIDDPIRLAEVIKSARTDAQLIDPTQINLKYLLMTQFNKDTSKFLKFIAQVFETNGYSKEFLKEFTDKVLDDLAIIGKEHLRDTLFEGYGRDFGSKIEKEVILLFRDEFLLQCVPSNITVPSPSDFELNKSHFIIDFIIYCDVLRGLKTAQENNIEYHTPDIIKQVILIGEYYGFGGDQVVKVLDKDLLNPDGTIAFSAGHAITRTEAYRYKTQFKKITEEFCARAIGCKTISIGQANSRKTQLSEAIKGLDQNKVLYSPATISLPQTSAMNQLIHWYSNIADDLSKSKSYDIISKYIDLNNFNPKPGTDFKFNKYTSLIEASKKKIESIELTNAIMQNNADFKASKLEVLTNRMQKILDQLSSNNLTLHETQELNNEGNTIFQTNDYFNKIQASREKYRSENEWRIEALDKINSTIHSAIESGKSINDKEVLSLIGICVDFSKSPSSLPKDTSITKNAFNYKKQFLKGYNIKSMNN